MEVIDSHTGGEPTRVVIGGGPDLGVGPMDKRRTLFRQHYDAVRSAVVCEPRGSDVMVGALLVPPVDKKSATGVIFFNNVDYLGMCVHGTIGVVATLAYMRHITTGAHRIETPVGMVTATLHDDGRISVTNVESYRTRKPVAVEVPGHGILTGDVAWGGNWFFLCSDHGQRIAADNVERLTEFSWQVRMALGRAGITGEDGGEIDHIELFGASRTGHADSRNFVLCPGKAYDRSPCGTGTSAKLACLAADGVLSPGQLWRQESIIGSVFEGSYEETDSGRILPTITGSAFITAETTLLIDPCDPFRSGIPVQIGQTG
ncbi:MAG: 4-hydroxyproline epimerase [Planctomycetales bacterium]|nr:4-hydroxyproline epimerase [Planctomycetales bacterium]